jgi:hypothetical protein
MYRQTNIGGTASPEPPAPIALFSCILLYLRFCEITTPPVPAEGSRTGTDC